MYFRHPISKGSHMEGKLPFNKSTHVHNLTKGTVGNISALSSELEPDSA